MIRVTTLIGMISDNEMVLPEGIRLIEDFHLLSLFRAVHLYSSHSWPRKKNGDP